MVTLEAKPARPGPAGQAPGSSPFLGRRAGAGLLVGLLILIGYALFSHGAITAPAEPRLQVATALLAVLVAMACLWTDGLRVVIPRKALLGLAGLALFAIWSGLSLIWSVAPNLTWLELNRDTTYVLVLGLGLVLGSWAGGGPGWAGLGFLVLAALVTLYAIGQKLLPGVHLGGLFNLNQTARIARLQEPLGYWNALALLLAMAAPLALAATMRRAGSGRLRLIWLVALELMFVTVGFTYSRGGLFVLVIGLVVCVALTGEPLRALMWLAAGALAAAPAIWLGLTSSALTANDVPLARRESAGGLFLVVLVSCSVVLWLVGDRLQQAERTLVVPDQVRKRMVQGLGLRALLALTIAAIGLALSARGLVGTFSHLWSSFTSTGGISVSNPARLLSADSANRWVWWKEAAGAFSSRPVAGWGAGSFPVVHLLFRQNTLSVQHPHSMPLQWLADTGIVGLVLVGASWVLLVSSGFDAVRRHAPGPARVMGAGLLALVVAYSVHCLYDWDWDIPGLTFPMLALWGVLIGSSHKPIRGAHLPLPRGGPSLSPGFRLLAIALSTVALCLFALSCVLPSLAASDASSALLAAARSTPAAVAEAQTQAAAAASLDPVSDAGPRAEAVIAAHRDDFQLARAYLLEAVRREPSDVQAWSNLAVLDALTGHPTEVGADARHLVELDPRNPATEAFAFQLAHRLMLLQAPPQDSATRIPTP